jgi:hypothetical protein
MPKIPSEFIESIVFVYPSEHDARAGAPSGATAFLVRVAIDRQANAFQVYAVTNNHVLAEAGAEVVLRLNSLTGGTDLITTSVRDWSRHPDGDDVAVYPLQLAHGQFQYTPIDDENLLRRDRVDSLALGSDTFFIGRFVGQDGKHRNLPTARFGTIARMPDEPIPTPYGIDQGAFLVEARSISGYSGSPVFTFWEWQGRIAGPNEVIGIDCGHLANYKPVLGSSRVPITENWSLSRTQG